MKADKGWEASNAMLGLVDQCSSHGLIIRLRIIAEPSMRLFDPLYIYDLI